VELHNEKLYDLYSSPNIIQAIISCMRWAGQAARMGDKERCIQGLGGKPEEKETIWKTLGVDGRITL
jgi:hypothetical protein